MVQTHSDKLHAPREKLVLQVRKLERHVVAQKDKMDTVKAEADTAAAATAEETSKLQARLQSMGGELARQRLINRQLKSQHIEQMANLAARQHQAASAFHDVHMRQLTGARRCAIGRPSYQCAACKSTFSRKCY